MDIQKMNMSLHSSIWHTRRFSSCQNIIKITVSSRAMPCNIKLQVTPQYSTLIIQCQKNIKSRAEHNYCRHSSIKLQPQNAWPRGCKSFVQRTIPHISHKRKSIHIYSHCSKVAIKIQFRIHTQSDQLIEKYK
jgi:hypothetical protein